MKLITNIFRVLIGLTFIFSGFVKLDDPTGFSYKLDEYFSVFAGDVEAKQDSIEITVNYLEESASSKRQLFVNEQTVSYSSVLSPWIKTVSTAQNESESPTDSIWAANYSVFLNDELILSKNVELNDSSQPISSNSRIEIGGNEIRSFSHQISLAESFEAVNESVDIIKYVKPNSWMVGFFKGLKPYALYLGIFVSLLEALLGFALLIGWKSRFTALMLLLITLFFTFLTWYSWHYDKVTDCGCFGDAIPLNPYESFIKNLIFLAMILFVLWKAKLAKPIFSNPFAVKVMAVFTLIGGSFALYCKHYLPVIDFLKFKEGNNVCELMQIPEGERTNPWKITTYEYLDENGNAVEIKYDSDKNTFEPSIGKGWKYQRVVNEEFLEDAYEPPIHDFMFMDLQQNNDYIDDFLSSDQKLLVVMHDLDKVNLKAIPKIVEIANKWKAEGKAFWALTSSSAVQAEQFRHDHNLPFELHIGDNTNLKSIIRSNPGLLLFTDTCVVKKSWPSTRLPRFKKIEKLTR